VVPALAIGFCAYLLYSLGWTTLMITAAILVTAALLYLVRFGSLRRRAELLARRP
jgi:hypothetical protein